MSNFYIGESEVFPRMLPTKLDSLGKGVSEEKMFSEISQSERINRNFIGSILGRTSIKIANLVPIR
jgi:hypothetical protein